MNKAAPANASAQPGENAFLTGEDAIELLLIAEQLIQLPLIRLDALLVGEDLPLVRENLPLICKRRLVCH
jgi:hypothetical protein